MKQRTQRELAVCLVGSAGVRRGIFRPRNSAEGALVRGAPSWIQVAGGVAWSARDRCTWRVRCSSDAGGDAGATDAPLVHVAVAQVDCDKNAG